MIGKVSEKKRSFCGRQKKCLWVRFFFAEAKLWPDKKKITLRIDLDVVDFFKKGKF